MKVTLYYCAACQHGVAAEAPHCDTCGAEFPEDPPEFPGIITAAGCLCLAALTFLAGFATAQVLP